MRDAIVIGAGIIGATVARGLLKLGMEVLVLDDRRSLGGTRPSGGHLKPSWFSSMAKDEYTPAMELLEDLWGMSAEDFYLWPLGKLTTKVYRVDTDKVLKAPSVNATVVGLEHLENFPLVRYTMLPSQEQRVDRCRLLVVAAGAWCHELLPNITTTAKQGVSFRVEGRLTQPFIKAWAPYKQVVAHQQKLEEIWVGDGSAIIPKNWGEDRTAACRSRCLTALQKNVVGSAKVKHTIYGLRAYAKQKSGPCLLERIGPRTWVATGAGKSGTISAGWVARRILDANS